MTVPESFQKQVFAGCSWWNPFPDLVGNNTLYYCLLELVHSTLGEASVLLCRSLIIFLMEGALELRHSIWKNRTYQCWKCLEALLQSKIWWLHDQINDSWSSVSAHVFAKYERRRHPVWWAGWIRVVMTWILARMTWPEWWPWCFLGWHDQCNDLDVD